MYTNGLCISVQSGVYQVYTASNSVHWLVRYCPVPSQLRDFDSQSITRVMVDAHHTVCAGAGKKTVNRVRRVVEHTSCSPVAFIMSDWNYTGAGDNPRRKPPAQRRWRSRSTPKGGGKDRYSVRTSP